MNNTSLIEQYKALYATQYSEKTSRLPNKVENDESSWAKFNALYEITVEQRGHKPIRDEFTQCKLKEIFDWLTLSSQRGLLLYGSLGNGKTTMLRTISRFIGSKANMVNAKGLYDYFKLNERLPDFSNNVLLIDDLGIEPVRCLIYGEEHHPLTDELLYRYNSNVTTIVSTNLNFEEIRQRYGERVFDRMYEMFTPILFNAPSYRPQI
jgi:DNA replication protein